MAWIVKLVTTGADGEEQCADVMTINRPDDLGDIANLGLTLADVRRACTGCACTGRTLSMIGTTSIG